MHLINYVTRIQMGFGALSTLPQELALLGITKPLLITDKGIVHAGLLNKTINAMGSTYEYVVYDETLSNPTENEVNAAAALYQKESCDGLIGIGGGSPIDLAKGVALRVSHQGELEEYSVAQGGREKIKNTVPKVIGIPTTAGTGSEVSGGSLLILNDGRKLVFSSTNLIPASAICDPALTMGLPPWLTAATGMDAIAHCIETFLSPRFNPPADGIALDGLERAWANIERVYLNGQDKNARLQMLCSSTQGALAFQKGLGAVHALSHPLGALRIDGKASLHHGTLNAIVLPAVLRFNQQAPTVIREQKYQRLARAMHLPSGSDLAEAIEDINKRLDIPKGLAQIGVTHEMLPAVAQAAVRDASHGTNPIEPSVDDYLEMLKASM